jgi:hypothetical protein
MKPKRGIGNFNNNDNDNKNRIMMVDSKLDEILTSGWLVIKRQAGRLGSETFLYLFSHYFPTNFEVWAWIGVSFNL